MIIEGNRFLLFSRYDQSKSSFIYIYIYIYIYQFIPKLRKVANGLEPKLRRKQAADMMELTWDIELAKGAQMWANQCLFEHDGRRTCKFNWIGQNSFRAFFKENPSSRTENWKGYIDGWYAEVSSLLRLN